MKRLFSIFLSEHTLDPLLIETPLSGELNGVKYAGTPDCVGAFDGKLSILDWKFVSQVQKTRVGAQLNGYQHLCECNGIFHPLERACIAIDIILAAAHSDEKESITFVLVYQQSQRKYDTTEGTEVPLQYRIPSGFWISTCHREALRSSARVLQDSMTDIV